MDIVTWRLSHANRDTYGPVITFDNQAEDGIAFVVGGLLRGLAAEIFTYDGQHVEGLINVIDRTLVLTDIETNQEEVAKFDLYEDVAEIRYL